VMVRRKRQIVGFGFDPGESSHHFAVVIPENEDTPVTIEERFEWNGATETLSDTAKAPIIKVLLDRYRWGRIAEAARGQFNNKIRSGGHRSVSWKTDQPNILPPHFGKELTLLAWAVEEMDESLIPNVIANWTGLEPEERWWLYTTVNATFTKAEVGKDRGWRKAIKIAFSENPIPEIPGERFVEEPEPIRLPQKEDILKVESSTPAYVPKKKKRDAIRKSPQVTLFEDS
jgi:hypothetical protein